MNIIQRESKRAVLFEILVFLAVAFALKALFTVIFWKFAGPVSLIVLLALLTFYFRFKGLSWRDFGLIKLNGFRDYLYLLPKVILTFMVFAMAMGLIQFAQETFDLAFMNDVGDGFEQRFGDIRGSLPMFILWVVIAWTAAAFGEEMAFRGYLVTRLNTALGESRLAMFAAIVIAALIFGFGHYYYQGLRGFVMITIVAIVFGLMFVLFKRNLYPVVIVHGLVDTMGFCAIYFGWQDV